MLVSYSVFIGLWIAALALPLLFFVLVMKKWKLGPVKPGLPLALSIILSLAFILLSGSRGRNVYVIGPDLGVSRYISFFGGSYVPDKGAPIAVRGRRSGNCTVINLSSHRLKVEGEGPNAALGGDRHVGPGHMDVFKCPRIDFFPLTQPREAFLSDMPHRSPAQTWYWLLAVEPRQLSPAQEEQSPGQEFMIEEDLPFENEVEPREDWEEMPVEEVPAPVIEDQVETE